MAGYVEIARIGEISSGTIKMVVVKDRELLLARVGSKVFCTQNRCPHMGGSLAGGRLAGTVVQCPRHGSQFDLVDGKVVRWTNWSGLLLFMVRLFKPPRSLTIYPVKIEGDKILVSGL